MIVLGTEIGIGTARKTVDAGGAGHETGAADHQTDAGAAGHARGHAGQGHAAGIAGEGQGHGIGGSGGPWGEVMEGEAGHVHHSGLYSS